MVDTMDSSKATATATGSLFPFMRLPRELRDQVYNHACAKPDPRGNRALRIERRHLKYFCPTAATILLLLHHEYLLLNRQIAQEALEVLFKQHTLYLSCGPFVLKTLLTRIEENAVSRDWLKWINKIELEWVTFPDLRMYPPNRSDGKDEWWWENTSGSDEMDYDYDGHDDEHDHEGSYYDDNFYDPTDTSLYPSYAQSTPSQAPAPGMADGPAFPMPLPAPLEQTDIATKLDLLVSLEVTPLFAYLSTPSFALSSITVPLYFMNQTSFHARFAARPDYALPLKIRYWAHVAAHALAMLRRPAAATTLAEVRVKYMPWDIWASMNPADDLHAMVETGVWGDETEDEDGDGDADEQRGAKGMAFRAVWMALLDMGVESPGEGLSAHVRFVKWEGDLDKWRVGDELEVVFTRKEAQPEGS